MSRRNAANAHAQAAPLFAALGDETRLALVSRLGASGPLSIARLTDETKVTRQAVTKHLVILEAANLVVVIWRGREKLHYLNPVPIHEIADRWIEKFERGRLRVLAELKKQLEAEAED